MRIGVNEGFPKEEYYINKLNTVAFSKSFSEKNFKKKQILKPWGKRKENIRNRANGLIETIKERMIQVGLTIKWSFTEHLNSFRYVLRTVKMYGKVLN